MDSRRKQLQKFYLHRLERISDLAGQGSPGNEVAAEQSGLSADARRQLVFRAVFSTYLDCKQQGVEDEARKILGKSPMAESFRALD